MEIYVARTKSWGVQKSSTSKNEKGPKSDIPFHVLAPEEWTIMSGSML